jgi:hypothetical protein
MGNDTEQQNEVDEQSHFDFRGEVTAISALSMGTDDEDFGLLIRSRSGSVAIVLDRDQERDLFAQVTAEHANRAQRLTLQTVPSQGGR